MILNNKFSFIWCFSSDSEPLGSLPLGDDEAKRRELRAQRHKEYIAFLSEVREGDVLDKLSSVDVGMKIRCFLIGYQARSCSISISLIFPLSLSLSRSLSFPLFPPLSLCLSLSLYLPLSIYLYFTFAPFPTPFLKFCSHGLCAQSQQEKRGKLRGAKTDEAPDGLPLKDRISAKV